MVITFRGLTIEHLGHATIRIETATGQVIYIDPWSEVLSDEPHDGDIVFVTHDDFDHYDPAGIDAVAGPGATVAINEAVDTDDLDRSVVSLPREDEVLIDDIEVLTLPAHNDPDGEHVDESGRPFHAEGEVVGLVLTIDETIVYYPSDTDFLSAHDRLSVDVFIPPIGGHYTMDRHQAAAFAESVEPELVVPVHYDTFEAIETDVGAFVEELEAAGIPIELD